MSDAEPLLVAHQRTQREQQGKVHDTQESGEDRPCFTSSHEGHALSQKNREGQTQQLVHSAACKEHDKPRDHGEHKRHQRQNGERHDDAERERDCEQLGNSQEASVDAEKGEACEANNSWYWGRKKSSMLPSSLPSSLSSLVHADTIEAASSFLDGIVIYVLSREWKDLLSIYVFNLHPLPNCSGVMQYSMLGWAIASAASAPACTPPAPSYTQALFAIGLLCCAALVRPRAEAAGWTMSVRMMGMCVGWCLADAIVQLQHEHALFMRFRVEFALVVMIGCAASLAARPTLRSQIDSWWVLSWLPVTVGEPVRSFLHSTHELFATSLETVVISVWIAVNERWVSNLTAAVNRLQQQQQRQQQEEREMGSGFDSADFFPDFDTYLSTYLDTYPWELLWYALGVTATTSAIAVLTVRWHRRHLAPNARISEVERARENGEGNWKLQLAALSEGACGGLTGAAWVSAVFVSHVEPSALGTLQSALRAMFLTSVALLWLTLPASRARRRVGDDGDGADDDWHSWRMHTAWLAQYATFLTNACSWFVGWSWIVLIRDVQALGAAATITTNTQPLLGIFVRVDVVNRLGFAGQLLGVLLFGPLMTLSVYLGRNGGMRAVKALLGDESTPDALICCLKLCCRQY